MKREAEIREALAKTHVELSKLRDDIRRHLDGKGPALSLELARQSEYALDARVKALEWVLGL